MTLGSCRVGPLEIVNGCGVGSWPADGKKKPDRDLAPRNLFDPPLITLTLVLHFAALPAFCCPPRIYLTASSSKEGKL